MPKPSKGWKAPITGQGKACRRCKRGNLCPSHRQRRKPAKSEGKRTSYKLNRSLLDELPTIVDRSRCYTEIWEALGISHATFYEWMHQGEAHVEDGKASMFREFYETVTYQRLLLAQRMKGVAVRAAEGVVVQKETGDGPRIYKLPPDGRLAASIAARLDPVAMPPEKQTVEHSGGLTVAMEARERLRSAFPEGRD